MQNCRPVRSHSNIKAFICDIQQENLKYLEFSKQSLVDLLQQQLFWLRKPGIVGNIHRSVVFRFIK